MIDPVTVALYLPGDIPIYAFPLILGLGASLGLAWLAWRSAPDVRLRRVDSGLITLVAALVGGRLGFAAAHGSYFWEHPLEILQLYRGGLAWPGAVLGALLGLRLAAWLTAASPLELLDDLLPLSATLTVSSWLGCWLDGCAYGPLAPNDWWGIPSLDQWGSVMLRWPTQLFGAVLALALFWILDQAREQFSRPGLAGSLGLFALFLQLFALSFLRADPVPLLSGLRLDTWAALVLTLLTLLGLAWLIRQPAPSEPELQAGSAEPLQDHPAE